MVIDGFTEYEFDDGRIESLAGGQFLAIPPNVRHRGRHDVRRPARLLGLLLDPQSKNATRNSPFTPSDLRWLIAQLESGQTRTHRIHAPMQRSINALAKLLEEFDSADNAKVISMRLLICSTLIDAAQQSTDTDVKKPQQFIEKAIDFMKVNLSSEVSIDSVALAVKCSRAKLFAVFKESAGMTPHDYWLRLRIDHAQELLRSSKMSITKIAMDCGFSTSQYFSTVFKKYAGTSPMEYRRNIQE